METRATYSSTDQTRFTTALGPTPGNGKPATDPVADLDLDGDVDLTDSAAFTVIKNARRAMTELFASAVGNPFHFTTRRLYMLETLPSGAGTQANQQLQHNRARHYSPMDGRWLQRDPAQLVPQVPALDSSSEGSITQVVFSVISMLPTSYSSMAGSSSEIATNARVFEFEQTHSETINPYGYPACNPAEFLDPTGSSLCCDVRSLMPAACITGKKYPRYLFRKCKPAGGLGWAVPNNSSQEGNWASFASSMENHG